MVRNNFLLVDLNESKTKKLAETITSETSRKILNYLAEKEDSEANISTALGLPISTVHYHLQKLMEANLVKVEDFHYSAKGREVNHYKLANKYIIIAPGKISGLREKLKGILPAGLIILGISAVIKLVSVFGGRTGTFAAETGKAGPMLESAADGIMVNAAPLAAPERCLTGYPDIALWFLIGGLVTIILYTIIRIIKEK